MAVAVVALPQGSSAADLPAYPVTAPLTKTVEPLGPHCRRVWRCQGEVCQWRTTCGGSCPDRFSCYPLYGAYGPYGGQGYWSAYSYTPLSYR
ncbi:hypothetical protein BRADO7060 [Bradyrhizobium sp. ORS 278]|nr:hypothetical protein BRADO7060 [Bradyrhizobium sp. ORS 278]